MLSSNLTKLRLPRSVISVDTPKRGEFLKDGVPNPSKDDILGRGSYGTVIKAIYKGKQVAVKMIDNMNKDKLTSVKSESNILGWQHDNIIEILKIDSGPRYAIVIMERFPGQCLQHILDRIKVPFYHVVRISIDIADALEYCHDRNLVHLDIKPQNVLIAIFDQDEKSVLRYICKLCDFGSSVVLEDQENRKITTRGTVRYMAPELLKNDPISTLSDIYSLGITMWQVRTGENPYSMFDQNETVAYKVVKENLRPDSESLKPSKLLLTPQNDCLCRHFSSDKFERSIDNIQEFLNSTKFNRTASPLRQRTPNKRIPFLNLNQSFNCQNTDSFRKSPRSKDPIQNKTNKCVAIQINSETFEESFVKIFAPVLMENEISLANEFKKLYRNCWANEPNKRPSAVFVKSSLKNFLLK